MDSPPAPARVAAVFADGVHAVQSVAAAMDASDWDRPACGIWSGADTARHLLAVATWYHEWLDRALAGKSSPPFAPEEMDDRNQRNLAMLASMPARTAIDEFAASAADYLERVRDNWDVPYGYPYGTVTAGLHCGVAAAEWHLHAWDLSRNQEPRHIPEDAAGLFIAAGTCVAAATGGVSGRLTQWLVPLGARLAPWKTLLKRSGRTL